MQALAQAAQTLGQKMYAEEQAKAQQGEPQAAQAEGGKKDENVVDAEFTEVKDKKAGS
jgi:molecular chaperone DnaK